jgi:hypothetical protein
MALPAGHKQNFETLQEAFANGDVALMECLSAATGETVAVICAANRLPDGEIEFVPFASLFDGNPYEAVNPPNPGGGFFNQDEVWNPAD